ncbi:hypothetical protein [Mesorhizobium sp. M0016]|uniref:hypothetical protein n=1 Tax=Mesorhizobium sp. M0016 TaxID=2956843 RepID=UPI003336DD97
MRGHSPYIPLIVDAPLGRPYAATVVELGFDAVLLNTAVPRAADPVAMARAFGKAVDAVAELSARECSNRATHRRSAGPSSHEVVDVPAGLTGWCRSALVWCSSG